MKVTLFFTYGISLKRWAERGILKREISFYRKLIESYGIEVLFVTYGDETDRRWEKDLKGIELLPVYERLRQPKFKVLGLLQSLFIPSTFRRELTASDLFKTNQIWGGWVAVVAKWRLHRPLLTRCGYDFHEFIQRKGNRKLLQRFAWLISYLTYNQADKIHVATKASQKTIHKKFSVPIEKMEIRPNWIDTNRFQQTKDTKTLRLLSVGRLDQQKNLPLLFDAIQGTNIGVDIVGVGPESDSLRQLAGQKHIDVNFIGQLSSDEMPHIYNQHAIYVLCSKYEGNPKTLLEAMACGNAVIGTDVAGIQDIIIHEKNGLLVPEEPIALRDAIYLLMGNCNLRNQLGSAARIQVVEYNSLDKALYNERKAYTTLITPSIKPESKNA